LPIRRINVSEMHLLVALQCLPVSSSAADTDKIWEQTLAALGLSDCRMLSESKIDPFRRIYHCGGEVLKIVLHDYEKTGTYRRTDPSSEFHILEQLRPVPSVPGALGFTQESGASILRMEYREGEALRGIQMPRWRVVPVIGRIAQALFTISLRGVAHNDLTPNNVIVSGNSITLVDFDQATRGSVSAAFASNFALWERKSKRRFGSLFMLAGFLVIRTNPGLATTLQNLPGHFSNIDRDNQQ
jgi:predicted Ser/Thr protein kinase